MIGRVLLLGAFGLSRAITSQYTPPPDFRLVTFEEQTPALNIEDRFFTIRIGDDSVGVRFARLEADEFGSGCNRNSLSGHSVEIADLNDQDAAFAEPLLWLRQLGFEKTLWHGVICAKNGGSLDEEVDFPLVASLSAWGSPGVRERVRTALVKSNGSWRAVLKAGRIGTSGRNDEGRTIQMFQSNRGTIESRIMKSTSPGDIFGKKSFWSQSCKAEAIFSWTPAAMRVDFQKNSRTRLTLFVSANPAEDLVKSFERAQKQLCSAAQVGA